MKLDGRRNGPPSPAFSGDDDHSEIGSDMVMIRFGVLVCAACAILAGCGHNTEQRSATGAGSGIVAGALVAGPVGALVGAAAGGAGGAAVSEAEKENRR